MGIERTSMDDGATAAKNALARRIVSSKTLQDKNDVLSASLDAQTRKHNKLKQARFNASHGRVIGLLSLLTSVSFRLCVGKPADQS